MKKLKGSFMALIVIVTLVCFVNYGYVGKEAKAYSLDAVVFASGMDLYFQSGSADRAGIGDPDIPYESTLLDIGNWENHGVVNGSPSLTWGRYGKALSFDGTDDYIIIPNSASLYTPSEQITVEFWVYPTNLGTAQEIMRKRSGNYGWRFLFDTNKLLYFTVWNSSTFVEPSYNFTSLENTWTHVAGTTDGTTIKLYINSELVDSKTIPSGLEVSSDHLYIGFDGVSSNYFYGTIDEVRIYPIILVEADVKGDMNNAMNKFDEYWFTRSYLEENTVYNYYETNVTDRTEYINNDPELPSAVTGNNNNDFSEMATVRFIPGFQSYRYYCTLYDNSTGGYARFIWRFSLFRDGVEQSVYLLIITSFAIGAGATSWEVDYYRLNPTFAYKTYVIQYKSYETHYFPVIVDAWVGSDRKHFTMRVTPENTTVSPQFDYTYAFELMDSDGNTHVIDWFDGWVKEETLVQSTNDYIHAEIASHKLILTLAIVATLLIVGALAYQWALRPILQATTGLALPAIPIIPERPDDVVSAIGDLAHQIVGAFGAIGNSIIDALSPIVMAIMQVVNPLIQGFINFMGDILTALINVAAGLWTIIVSAADGLLYAIFPGLGPVAFSTFISGVTDFFVGLFTWVIASFGYLVTMLTSFFSMFTEVMGKFLNTLSTMITSWVSMIQNIFSMISGGFGQTYNIFETLRIDIWITLGAILYVVWLFAYWDEKGIDAVINHIQMVINILAWIFRLLLTVVQMFITIITSIIEALPGE